MINCLSSEEIVEDGGGDDGGDMLVVGDRVLMAVSVVSR